MRCDGKEDESTELAHQIAMIRERRRDELNSEWREQRERDYLSSHDCTAFRFSPYRQQAGHVTNVRSDAQLAKRYPSVKSQRDW